MAKRSKLPAIVETWRREAARHRNRNQLAFGKPERRGICFQIPPNAPGTEGMPRVKSGAFKGRLCWTSKQEAIDLGKRVEDKTGYSIRFDPD